MWGWLCLGSGCPCAPCWGNSVFLTVQAVGQGTPRRSYLAGRGNGVGLCWIVRFPLL